MPPAHREQISPDSRSALPVVLQIRSYPLGRAVSPSHCWHYHSPGKLGAHTHPRQLYPYSFDALRAAPVKFHKLACSRGRTACGPTTHTGAGYYQPTLILPPLPRTGTRHIAHLAADLLPRATDYISGCMGWRDTTRRRVIRGRRSGARQPGQGFAVEIGSRPRARV